jgi:hypothetical protein
MQLPRVGAGAVLNMRRGGKHLDRKKKENKEACRTSKRRKDHGR